MIISSQIDSTAKNGHPECIKHDLRACLWKKTTFFLISMLQLAENCPQW
jgi:hypothetical protein